MEKNGGLALRDLAMDVGREREGILALLCTR